MGEGAGRPASGGVCLGYLWDREEQREKARRDRLAVARTMGAEKIAKVVGESCPF